MSFEGFYQALCKNGHLQGGDCMVYEPDTAVCGICGEPIVWHELIDTTNGYDEQETKLEIDTPDAYCHCPICDNIHITEHERYKIPGA